MNFEKTIKLHKLKKSVKTKLKNIKIKLNFLNNNVDEKKP